MNSRLVFAITTTCLLAAPAMLTAQTVSAEGTLKVPVTLTRIGPDVSKVQVKCGIIADAITVGSSDVLTDYSGNRYVEQVAETPVSGGQVSTTASLVFSFTGLDNPAGKTARVTCILLGWSTTEQKWNPFNPQASNPSFRTLAVV